MKHTKTVITGGRLLEEAQKVLIMVHGRGADAQGILGLAAHLKVDDFALLAPQASGYTWYPHSFMAPIAQNEPGLSSALAVLDESVGDLKAKGFATDQIYFLGFSQGACLVLEYLARHPARYGGAVALTGGLIGQRLEEELYRGDFEGTRVFIGTGDPDPHVPLSRVKETAAMLERMQAAVRLEVYPGKPHTVSKEEIDGANEFVF